MLNLSSGGVMKKDKSLTFVLPLPAMADLADLAHSRRVSVGELVREGVTYILQTANDRGSVGSVGLESLGHTPLIRLPPPGGPKTASTAPPGKTARVPAKIRATPRSGKTRPGAAPKKSPVKSAPPPRGRRSTGAGAKRPAAK